MYGMACARAALLLAAMAPLQTCLGYAPAFPSMHRVRLIPGRFGNGGALSLRRRHARSLGGSVGAKAVAEVGGQQLLAGTGTVQETAAQVAQSVAAANTELPGSSTANVLPAELMSMYAAHPAATAVAGAFFTALALTAASDTLPKKANSPYPNGRYDASTAASYYKERPLPFLKRAAFISLSAAGFGLAVLFDILTGTYKKNEPKRADELTDLLTRLGPTFIKIGQSLSIRSDLLTPEYLRALTALQDKVPAFPTEAARETISSELGVPCDSVFSGIDKPVAAASLGQVYKATLKKDGRTVAVKVQRPGIVEQVALDMHLIRVAAPLIKALGAPGDIEGLVDDWGFGFVNELDYRQEANNADSFMESFKSTPLAKVVFAPPVVREASARCVLTTEWVEGERLEKSSAKDVSTLCSVAMNSYLTMMLETGTMHCDPHPGNLLRTPDGRLCILDWGLVQEMPADLRQTMIEHIAHLVSRDYSKVPNDLVLLGFVPEGQEEAVKSGDSSRVIAETYTKLMAGGGAANVDVNAVFTDLQGLTSRYGNLFQIPPYFAYIARAFGVLEGIGLSNEPDYAIIAECLPYISKRLLTDPNPRTGGALNTFIFGADKDDPNRVINAKRVQQLLEGFGDYSTAAEAASTLSASSSSSGAGRAMVVQGQQADTRQPSLAQTIESAADQVFDLLLTEESSPLQGIVIEQLARVVNAGVRSSWKTLRDRSGRLRNGRSVLGTLVDPLGVFAKSDLVTLDQTDKRVLASTQKLVKVLQEQTTMDTRALQALTPQEVREVAQIVTRKLWEKRRVVAKNSNRLAVVALMQTLDRLERGAAERGGISTSTLRRVEDRMLMAQQDSGTDSAQAPKGLERGSATSRQ